VRKVTLRRNGQVVEPLRGGHSPIRIGEQNELVDFTDVANFGYYLYSPEVFRPDAPQRAPEITIEIDDLKKPSVKQVERLAPAVIARLWNDFEAFFGRPGAAKQFMGYAMTKSCTVWMELPVPQILRPAPMFWQPQQSKSRWTSASLGRCETLSKLIQTSPIWGKFS